MGEITNQVFTLIFFVEFIIRIIAIGPKHYFTDGWNIFDFLIAIGSIVGLVLAFGTTQ